MLVILYDLMWVKIKHEEVVSDEEIPEEVLIVIKMTDLIELECPFVGCDLGVAGAKYKTPKLSHDMALQMIEMHAKSHDQGRGGDQQRQEPGNECFYLTRENPPTFAAKGDIRG